MSLSRHMGWSRPAILALLAALAGPAAAAAEGSGSAASAPPSHRPSRHHATLEDRVRTLTKALDLDQKQQAGVRRALEEQRGLINEVWADDRVPAAYKPSAVKGISDRTADQIRSLLNEQQRKKYNPPRPTEPAPPSDGRSVQAWMDAIQRR